MPCETTQARELAACPFCGSADVTLQSRGSGGRYLRVRCHGCATVGPLVHYNKSKAIAAWNRRDPAPVPNGSTDADEDAESEAMQRAYLALRPWKDSGTSREVVLSDYEAFQQGWEAHKEHAALRYARGAK